MVKNDPSADSPTSVLEEEVRSFFFTLMALEKGKFYFCCLLELMLRFCYMKC